MICSQPILLHLRECSSIPDPALIISGNGDKVYGGCFRVSPNLGSGSRNSLMHCGEYNAKNISFLHTHILLSMVEVRCAFGGDR